MMSYDKYERGRQHLNGGHQRITYKKKKKKKRERKKGILTLRLTQSNQWVGVDHAARIHSLNSPPMTSSVERKENDSDDDMYDMLEIYEQCEYILGIKKNKQNRRDTHTSHKIADKNHSNMNNKK